MRIIGLDLGDRRIGIAVSDELGMLASGVESYTRVNPEADFAHLAEIVAQYKAGKIIVGLPLNMNGTRGPQAEKYTEMGLQLQQMTGVEVEFVDERLTTSAANRVLISGNVSRKKRKQVVDTMAAQLILQSYLDRH
jgi:putative Holliday junction resolvase